MTPTWPLGVDILEWKKAGSFYRRHRSAIQRLFSRSELAFVRSSRKPAESFALLFSAKEAVFKALGASWMGVTGFKDVQLFPERDFSFRLKGPLKKNFSPAMPLKISFKKTRYHVVTSCHPGSFIPCAGT